MSHTFNLQEFGTKEKPAEIGSLMKKAKQTRAASMRGEHSKSIAGYKANSKSEITNPKSEKAPREKESKASSEKEVLLIMINSTRFLLLFKLMP